MMPGADGDERVVDVAADLLADARAADQCSRRARAVHGPPGSHRGQSRARCRVGRCAGSDLKLLAAPAACIGQHRIGTARGIVHHGPVIAETAAHSTAGGMGQLQMQSRSECSGVAASMTGAGARRHGDRNVAQRRWCGPTTCGGSKRSSAADVVSGAFRERPRGPPTLR